MANKYDQFTDEDFEAEKQRRDLARKGGQAQPNAQALISQLMPKQNLGTGVGDFLTRLGGGKPDDSNSTLSNIYAKEAINKQFEDPTVRQLRQAEIDALSQPPPEGFVRYGKQTFPDPNFVKPADQAKMDEAAAADQREADSIRLGAQDTLNTIGEVKKGKQFFGYAGGLPSYAAPSSLIPGGATYGERQKWESNLKKLLAQKFVEIISNMKRVSKTGATGLGSMTEQEGAKLQAAASALNAGLVPDDAMELLDEMEILNKKILGQPINSGNSSLSDIDAELAEIDRQLGAR